MYRLQAMTCTDVLNIACIWQPSQIPFHCNPLMPTFDPENMRIMGHALKVIGTFLGNYKWNFENLRIAL